MFNKEKQSLCFYFLLHVNQNYLVHEIINFNKLYFGYSLLILMFSKVKYTSALYFILY